MTRLISGGNGRKSRSTVRCRLTATCRLPPWNQTGLAPVIVFFVLSGFVLTRLLENNPNWLLFFRNRALRLFPAAALVVVLLAVPL